MKLLTAIKCGLLLSALGTGVWMTQQPDAEVASCSTVVHTQFDGSQTLELSCLQVNQPSWSNWLTGKSRSTQFHFIDLVELLGQLKPTHENP
jgi:hypothetical protein